MMRVTPVEYPRPTWSEYVSASQRMAARAGAGLPDGVLRLPPTDAELLAEARDRAIVNAYHRSRLAEAAR